MQVCVSCRVILCRVELSTLGCCWCSALADNQHACMHNCAASCMVASGASNQSCSGADWLSACLSETWETWETPSAARCRAKVPAASHPALHPLFPSSSSVLLQDTQGLTTLYSLPPRIRNPSSPTASSEKQQVAILHQSVHLRIKRGGHQHGILTRASLLCSSKPRKAG